MSSLKKAGILVLFLLVLTLNHWAQVKTNGYFAYDYVNNQVDTEIIGGTFANPRLGFTLSGAITQNSNFVCEVLFREGQKIELKQAWVSLGFSGHFNPKLGLYMVPFGKYNESNRPYETVWINPPLTAHYLYPRNWRDMGFLIEGRIWSFHYTAYLGNGLKETDTLSKGNQFIDNNTNKSIGGRIGLFIDQGFEVSYSHYRGKYDANEERTLVYHGANVDWQTENFQVLAEYIKTFMENPLDYNKGEAEGYFVQMSIHIGNVSPTGSFQKMRYNDPFHGIGFSSSLMPGNGVDKEEKRWSVGLVYRVLENVMLKIEYDMNTNMKDESKNKALFCQLALNF